LLDLAGRELANRLNGQEPDYSALHDAWEVLVELAEQGKSASSILQPRSRAGSLAEGKRLWPDPKLQLIG
jgi:hypothetical protein